MTIFFRTVSPEETMQLGQRLARLLGPGDVVCLTGELGAGKTHFAKGIARGLCVREVVTSPTFTLIKEYEGRMPFYHMDVYRLEGPEELADLGYDEYFYGEGVTLIEWADRVADVLPDERLDIELKIEGELLENTRVFSFAPHGRHYQDLVEGMEDFDCTGD